MSQPKRKSLHSILSRVMKKRRPEVVPRRRVFGLERLEARQLLATVSLSGSGMLNINYVASGEAVTLTHNGTTITASGNAIGSFAASAVSGINVQDPSNGTFQSLTLSGSGTFLLPNGLNVPSGLNPTIENKIETVTFNTSVSATGTSAISVHANQNIVINPGVNLTTQFGSIVMWANQSNLYGGNFVGIDVNGATLGSQQGSIILRGRGGNSGNENHGVRVRNSATVGDGNNPFQVVIEGRVGRGSGELGSVPVTSNYGVLVDSNALVKSNGGNIELTGYSDGSGGNNVGVVVAHGTAVVPGGNGSVTISGTGGSGTGVYNVGSSIQGLVTSSGGNVFVYGSGWGSGASSQNHGVDVVNGGHITAGGMGSVVVGGGGGGAAGTNSTENHGVYVRTGSQISSSGGVVQVTGTGGGQGTGSYNHGVLVSGKITAFGTGNVIVNGTGGAVGTSGSSGGNHGVYLFGGGQITSDGTGNVNVSGLAGRSGGMIGSMGVIIFDTNTRITSSGGSVVVQGTGANSDTSDLDIGVLVQFAGEITSGGNGTVTVIGTGGAGSGNYHHGVLVTGSNSRIASGGSGSVQVTGNGGSGTGASTANVGVYLEAGGLVTSGGSGTVSVDGHGGTGTGSRQYGVLVTGSNSGVTSGGGNVQIDGTGGDSSSGVTGQNIGVYLTLGGIITAGASGSVTVEGTGGTGGISNHGVWVENSPTMITSSGGNVVISGLGGISTTVSTSDNSSGVFVDGSATVTAGGNGSVTVEGIGGTSSEIKYGVRVEEGHITSGGGDIFVTGHGGAPGFNGGYGIAIFGGKIKATGTGAVTIHGTGTDGRGGVRVLTQYNIVSGDGEITSEGGDVTVTGIGLEPSEVSAFYGQGSNGVLLERYDGPVASVSSGIGGNITISGTGEGAGGQGVIIHWKATVVANGGNINIFGTGGSGEGSIGVTTSYYSSIQSVGGHVLVEGNVGGPSGLDIALSYESQNIHGFVLGNEVSLIGDSVDLGSYVIANAVTLRPQSVGRQINLGGADGGWLGLTDAELDFVTATTLVVGDASSGAISITAPITRLTATNVQLIGGNNINFNHLVSTGPASSGTLLLSPGGASGAVLPTFSGVDAETSTVTFAGGRDLQIAINGTLVNADYNQLNASGSVNLTGADLVIGGAFPSITGNETFTIVSAASVIGTFNGLPNNSSVAVHGKFFSIQYNATNVQLVPTPVATIAASYVYHANSTFAFGGGAAGVAAALDTGKQLAKESAAPQQLGFNNLINTTRGINGLVFDIAGLHSTTLTAADFQFQWSPQGAFSEGANPPASWQAAPAPASITVLPGATPRVVLTWPDQTIMDRWLRVTVKATAATGLAQPEVYYLGHLQGETTGASGGRFTVLVADILQIRSALTNPTNASSIVDLDKSGVVLVADILASRSNLTKELTQITIPAIGGGGSGSLSDSDDSEAGAWSDSGSETQSEGLSLPSRQSLQSAAYAAAVDSAMDDLYATNQRRRGRRP